MKITVVSVQAPFVWGGAEYLAESLCERLAAIDKLLGNK